LDADRLVEAWDPEAPRRVSLEESLEVNAALAAAVAVSGSDRQAEALALKLAASKDSCEAAVALWGRISPAAQRAATIANLGARVSVIEELAAACNADMLEPGALRPIIMDPKLVNGLANGSSGGLPRSFTEARLVTALATMITPPAAEALLDHFGAYGVHQALPQVSALALNTALAALGQAQAPPNSTLASSAGPADGIGGKGIGPTERRGKKP
jgi:hypothetical protein